MTTKTETLKTWRDLLAVDPTLRAIDQQLAAYIRSRNVDNPWRIYERMKAQVERRVGRYADHAPEELRSCTAYEIAIEHVCDELGI